jgi:hypothetical protein
MQTHAVDFDSIPCDKLEFTQEVTRGSVHQHVPPIIDKISGKDDVGCSFSTVVETDKVSGSIRIGLSGPFGTPSPDALLSPSKGATKAAEATPQGELNIAHTVRRMLFNPPEGKSAASRFPEVVAPLINQKPSGIIPSSAVHHYSMQIVPTYFKG